MPGTCLLLPLDPFLAKKGRSTKLMQDILSLVLCMVVSVEAWGLLWPSRVLPATVSPSSCADTVLGGAQDMRGATPGSSHAHQALEQQQPRSPQSPTSDAGTYAEESDDVELASCCLRPPAGAWQRLWWLVCLPWCGPLAHAFVV